MQIKRFEAADMTDALRMVKREFGDEAVILSAKEIRPGGFFSALRKRHVEITAASDSHALERRNESQKGGFPEMLARQVDAENDDPVDRVSLSPATSPAAARRGHLDLSSPSAADGMASEQIDSAPVAGPMTKPVADHRRPTADSGDSRPLTTPGDDPAVEEQSPHLNLERLVAAPFYHRRRRRVIAFVGAAGVGKSTMIAKLAWHCCRREGQRVGLISLDRFRIGGNVLLGRVADILALPMSVARDDREFESALQAMKDVDALLVDTPGVGAADAAMLDEIAGLLQTARPHETHLVLNATVRQDILCDAVDRLHGLSPDRLLFTHLDEYGTSRVVPDLVERFGLATAFWGQGGDIRHGLEEASAQHLQEISGSRRPVPSGRVTLFPAAGGTRQSQRPGVTPPAKLGEYVANRNSELFHHRDCKSVKRINLENIAAFDSAEHALAEGFKPCRACCDPSSFHKPAAGVLNIPRARAL